MEQHKFRASAISVPMWPLDARNLGWLLNLYFPRDQLTGLNFLVDKDDLVIVALFVEGNEGEGPCFDSAKYPLRFLGDGFPPFEAWFSCYNRAKGISP